MAHCNTIFHQMLNLILRHVLGKLETEHGTGRQARSFTRWSQLVHLLSMQLTARVSLRDGVSSLKDYAWYGQLTAQKIFFVTRQKSNARYRVLARRPVNTALGLVSDETIQLPGAKARECPSLCAASFTRTPKPARFMCSSPTTSDW